MSFIIAAPAKAVSCDDRPRKGGALCVEVIGGHGDPNSPEARWARGEDQRPPSRARYWDFISSRGKHILPGQCWAVSPTVFVGRRDQVFFFISVSVGGTWEQPKVIIQSEPGLEDAPTPFHQNKRGLGLWTESLFFQDIDRQLGEYDILLGFGPFRSKRIVDNFSHSLSFRTRLRLSGVNKAFDSPNITLNGFREAFNRVNRCNIKKLPFKNTVPRGSR